MSKKQIKYSTSLLIKKMLIKIAVRYYYTPTVAENKNDQQYQELTGMQRNQNFRCWQSELIQPLWKKVLCLCLSSDSSVLLPNIYIQGQARHTYRDMLGIHIEIRWEWELVSRVTNKNVNSSFIHSCLKLQITQIFVNRMDKAQYIMKFQPH